MMLSADVLSVDCHCNISKLKSILVLKFIGISVSHMPSKKMVAKIPFHEHASIFKKLFVSIVDFQTK